MKKLPSIHQYTSQVSSDIHYSEAALSGKFQGCLDRNPLKAVAKGGLSRAHQDDLKAMRLQDDLCAEATQGIVQRANKSRHRGVALIEADWVRHIHACPPQHMRQQVLMANCSNSENLALQSADRRMREITVPMRSGQDQGDCLTQNHQGLIHPFGP